MEETLIEFKNFSFFYDEKLEFGLRNINLKINKGQITLISGPSGCGKSTMLKCMNGLITDFYEGKMQGECRILKQDINDVETARLAQEIGTVFQDPRSQFFTLHANSEVAFPSENLAHKRLDMQKAYSKTVKDLGIESILNQSIFKLSSGEKQKIAIASVYMAGVDIYLFDEPSANLDIESTKAFKRLLIDLKARGKTIVIFEHKIFYLKDIFDKLIILNQGSIVKELKHDELIDDSLIDKYRLRHLNLKELKLDNFENPNLKPQLLVRDMSFKYPKQDYLFKDVNLTFAKGDIVGIVGDNGVGKSTFIRILMGLEKLNKGQILYDEHKTSAKERIKKSYYAMQDVDYQFFEGTVLKEMLASSKKTKEDQMRALNILKSFDLDLYQDQHPSNLSGGQKQRLSIALSLMDDKPYLYFDEPTSGLDLDNMELVANLIKDEASKGAIAFVITHDYEFALKLFSSLIVIKDQTISQIKGDKFNQDILMQLFNVEEE